METGTITKKNYTDDCKASTSSQDTEELPIKKTSNLDTMIHLLKGNIGTGIFALPSAFKSAGLWAGVALVPIMAIMCTHCMQILIRCAALMNERETDFVLDYADVVEVACATGPKKLRNYAKWFRRSINIFICITQTGFCCIYLVFISTNVAQVVNYYTNLTLDVRIYMCLLTVPLIFLSCIRNLKYLAPVSLIANILQVVGIVIIFYYIFKEELPPTESVPGFGSWAGLPLFFGSVIFTFEGIALVLPLQRDMQRPQDFKGWTGLMITGMVIVTCLNVAMGFYGYLRYGEDIDASITLNLPSSDVLAEVVRALVALAIAGSYALQFYVPIPIIWPSLSKCLKLGKYKLIGEYGYRVLACLFILFLSALIPKIDLFTSLVGAFGSSFLALIFPPVLEFITHYPDIKPLMIIKNTIIILFGLIVFSTGTYASIMAIIEEFSRVPDSGHLSTTPALFE